MITGRDIEDSSEENNDEIDISKQTKKITQQDIQDKNKEKDETDPNVALLTQMKENKHYTVRTNKSGQKLYKCSVCPIRMKAKKIRTFNCHFMQHMKPWTYKCTNCPETFKGINSLNKHASWCTMVSRDYKQRGESTNLILNVNEHYEIDSKKENKYKCLSCLLNLKSFNVFRSHYLIKHTEIRPYECIKCLRTYARLDNFKGHYKICNGEKMPDTDNQKLPADVKERLPVEIMYVKEDIDIEETVIKDEMAQTEKENSPKNKTIKINRDIKGEFNTNEKNVSEIEDLKEILPFIPPNIQLISSEKYEEMEHLKSTELNPENIILVEDKDYNIIQNELDETIFVCIFCENYSPHIDEEAFKNHYLETHVDKSQFKCEHCETPCENAIDLQLHSLECTVRKENQTNNHNNTSKRPTRNRTGITRRFNTRTRKTPRKCKVCGKILEKGEPMQKHVKKFHKEAMVRYPCVICKRKFNEKKRAKICEMRHLKMYQTKCELCDKQFYDDNDLKSHINVQHTVEPIRCKLCDIVCKNRNSFNNHNYYKHGDNQTDQKCPQCDKMFTNRTSFRTHLRQHIGQICYLCGKYLKKNLEEHIARHTKEKNFECDICGKKFLSRRLVKAHEKMHTRPFHEKKSTYTCNVCPRKFNNRASLEKHSTLHLREELMGETIELD